MKTKRITKKDINKKELEYFVQERYTNVQIAKEMGCSKDFILDCIKYYGIQKASVSDVIKKQYADGRKVNCKIYDIPSKEDIEYLYHEKKMSMNKIKDIFDTSIPTLKKWMVNYGIELRGIGESVKNAHVTGELITHFNDKDFQEYLKTKRKKYNRSKDEKELFEFIKNNYNGEIKHSVYIGKYNYDIYLPELKVAIEYNGLYWHSEINRDDSFHKEKTEMCNNKGIHLIHIWEDDWNSKKIVIKNWLKGVLRIHNPKKIFGRKTKCVIVEAADLKSFFEEYHIQGYVNSSKGIALYHDGLLISACLFKIKEDKTWNLTRYVNHSDYQVIGGFSKMISNFRKEYPGKIYTFADLSWVSSSDNVYLRNGFIQDIIIKPDYSYIWNKKRCHKFNFRHVSLKRKLKNYDPSLTEKENCFNHEIWRIYDVGKLRYVLN